MSHLVRIACFGIALSAAGCYGALGAAGEWDDRPHKHKNAEPPAGPAPTPASFRSPDPELAPKEPAVNVLAKRM